MQLGLIGLGKMGDFMNQRLLKGGHSTVVYDRSAEAVQAAAALRIDGLDFARRYGQQTEQTTRHLVDDPGGSADRIDCRRIDGHS